jgi:Tfp pilus assembly protein PilO
MTALSRFWLPGAWLVLVAMGIFLTIMPQRRAIDLLVTQEAVYSDAARKGEDGADELAQLTAKLKLIRTTAEGKTKPIPVRGDVASLIRDLTAELDQRGITEHEIATGMADEIGGVLSIPVSINLTGSFLGIYASIQWLESMPRLIRVLRLEIEKPGRSAKEQLTASNNAVKAELVVNVYYDPSKLNEGLSMTDAQGGRRE